MFKNRIQIEFPQYGTLILVGIVRWSSVVTVVINVVGHDFLPLDIICWMYFHSFITLRVLRLINYSKYPLINFGLLTLFALVSRIHINILKPKASEPTENI